METISVEIKGIVPILFNQFTDKAKEDLENRSQGKKKTKEEKIIEADGKCYRLKDQLGFPALNIKKSILEGCSFAGIKIGRRSAMPFLRAVMFISPEFVFFGQENTDGIHECTGRIPPGPRGAMVILRRPYLDTGWKLNFEIIIADTRVTFEMVKIALNEAGLLIGIGDHRPEYGRFKVAKFTKKKAKK